MRVTTARLLLLTSTLCLGLAVSEAPAQSPVPPTAQHQVWTGYTTAELDQMLAPIALYPDVLLSTVLIAATYPLEVVQAARWSRANPALRGEDAVAAVAREDWDPAVKALVAFPDILQQLDANLDWTQGLGEAFLYQEAEVMDSVQQLRNRAAAAGQLRSDEHVRVVHTERTVVIEPVRERVVYVPWYDTRVVYGPWWHPWHPPVVWHAPAYYRPVRSGFYWSSGFVVSPGFFFSTVYWPQRHVLVLHQPRYVYVPPHRPRPVHYVPGKRWQHQPHHRRGVDYRHPDLRQRYAAPPRPPARRDDGRPRVVAPSPGGSREHDRRSAWESGTRDRRPSELASSWQGRQQPPQGTRRQVSPPAAVGESARGRERLSAPPAAQPRRDATPPRAQAPTTPRPAGRPEGRTAESGRGQSAVPGAAQGPRSAPRQVSPPPRSAPPRERATSPQGTAPRQGGRPDQGSAPRERAAASSQGARSGASAPAPRARSESPPARPARAEGAAPRGPRTERQGAAAPQSRGRRSAETG